MRRGGWRTCGAILMWLIFVVRAPNWTSLEAAWAQTEANDKVSEACFGFEMLDCRLPNDLFAHFRDPTFDSRTAQIDSRSALFKLFQRPNYNFWLPDRPKRLQRCDICTLLILWSQISTFSFQNQAQKWCTCAPLRPCGCVALTPRADTILTRFERLTNPISIYQFLTIW